MRALIGLLGLLITLAIVSVLVRQQMRSTPTLQAPASVDVNTHNVSDTVAIPSSGTPTQQSQQVQQKYKQVLDNAMQARPMPDDQP